MAQCHSGWHPRATPPMQPHPVAAAEPETAGPDWLLRQSQHARFPARCERHARLRSTPPLAAPTATSPGGVTKHAVWGVPPWGWYVESGAKCWPSIHSFLTRRPQSAGWVRQMSSRGKLGCGNDSRFQQPYDITEGITSRQMAIAPVLMPILRLSKMTVFETSCLCVYPDRGEHSVREAARLLPAHITLPVGHAPVSRSALLSPGRLVVPRRRFPRRVGIDAERHRVARDAGHQA